MALNLPIGLLKKALGWSWYRDTNPVLTSLLTVNLANAVKLTNVKCTLVQRLIIQAIGRVSYLNQP